MNMRTSYNDVLQALSTGDRNSAVIKGLFDILSNTSMPNLPTRTMGGAFFWNTLAERNGWKLQQNMLTQHARILDSSNRRIAWGGIQAMMRTMDRMVSLLENHRA